MYCCAHLTARNYQLALKFYVDTDRVSSNYKKWNFRPPADSNTTCWEHKRNTKHTDVIIYVVHNCLHPWKRVFWFHSTNQNFINSQLSPSHLPYKSLSTHGTLHRGTHNSLTSIHIYSERSKCKMNPNSLRFAIANLLQSVH